MRLPWKSQLSPYILSAVVLALTAFGVVYTGSVARKHREARFDSTADSIRNAVVNRLATYQNFLLEARGALHVAPDLTHKQFHTYVEDLHLFDLYPGIRALGFVERVPRAGLAAFAKKTLREDGPGYYLWPAGDRDEYEIIRMTEPPNARSVKVRGFDMLSDPVRRLALEQARDTGDAVATTPLRLAAQDLEGKREVPSFLLLAAIYRTGGVPPTVEERRRQLRGFVYGPFRVEDLLNAIFPLQENPAPLAFEVSIANREGVMRPYYLYQGVATAKSSSLLRQYQISVGGQPWQIRVTPSEEFLLSTQDRIPFVISVAGALLALLCFVLLRSQSQYAQAEKERSQQLNLLNQVGRRVLGQLEMEKVAQEVTDAGRELTGAAFGAFFYNQRDGKGEYYLLHSISGARREDFAKFPNPRNTRVFAPTFAGDAIVRSDDITADPRYGKNAPYHGLPPGHPPLRSYLAVPVKSAAGRVIGGLFFGHPLPAQFGERTEQLVAGIAVQAGVAMDNAQLYQDAQDAVRARDEFLRIASHELKTPLTPLKLHMQGLTRALQKPGPPDPVYLNKIARIADQQITRISTLVDDLLDVSRISAGLLKLNAEAVDLTQLLSESVERFRPQMAAAGMEVRAEIAAHVSGRYDQLRLEQVVANLITNAVKYAPGAPLTVSLRQIGTQLEVRVADQGPGVAIESREKVFERFERAGMANGSAVGLGLGLYITRQIVEAHGGSIRLEAPESGGAAFVVLLPADDSIPAPPAA